MEKKSITFMERMACRVLSHLRYNESDEFYKCWQNDLTPVLHECEANAQALIFISRKRLCNQASPETKAAWQEVKEQVSAVDPVLGSVMVPECIYRGFCPEFHSCGYVNTEEYTKRLAEYRSKEVAA